jgi:hypothetical protein
MRAIKLLLITASTLLAGAGALAAQTPPTSPGGTPGQPKTAPAPDPKLSFDREVFSYVGEGRKDPFAPLTGTDAIGPLFEDLRLHGILYSNDPKSSVVLIYDGAKRPYRLHVGDLIGNARVSAIEKTQVKFLVQSYGLVRQEVMNLERRKTLAELQTQQQREQQENLQKLFQQELLKALQGQDTTRRQTPPPPTRRDTSAARPRNNN